MNKKHSILAGLLFALALPFSSSAQKYSFQPSDTVYVSIAADDVADMQLNVKNLTESPIKFSWKRLSNNMLAGWDYSLCDYANCYIGMPSGGNMASVIPGNYGYLKITAYPNGKPGTGTVRFLIYETGTPQAEGDTVTFILNATQSTVGIAEVSKINVTLYPNPASDFIQVTTAANTIFKKEIYNLTGTKVAEFDGERQFVGNLNSGIYFLRLSGENGERLVKKFIIE